MTSRPDNWSSWIEPQARADRAFRGQDPGEARGRPLDQLRPVGGVEPRKTRTCVVVSNDVANEFGATVTVVPTQAFTAERASRVYMVDLRKPRSTLTDSRVANGSMIMTYDRARIVAREGRLHRDALAALDRALSVHLGLAPP